MAKTTNDHTGSEGAHEHEGSSVPFYIFIALVLGVITYVEFALVEYQDTWFAALSGPWILTLLVVLSVVKFLLVVMFFMHLKGDDRTFTGFFSSGMAIAVGTLFALSALFTVRSLATAQTPQEEGPVEARAALPEGETQTQSLEHEEITEANAQAHEGETQAGLAHRFEYPAPKTLNVDIIDLTPEGQLAVGGSVVDAGGFPTETGTATQVSGEGRRTAAGIPLAAPVPAITLPDPFAQVQAQTQQAQTQRAQTGGEDGQAAQQAAGAGDAQGTAGPTGGAGALLVDADVSAGEAVYSSNCASCHQADGAGIPGAFPPVAGHAPELAVAEGGREYLIHLLLGGLQGEIEVAGQTYNGVMPAWAQLSDDELASTLNYVLSSWGNADALPPDYPAFTAEEVAAQRDAALSAAEVYELRQTLELP